MPYLCGAAGPVILWECPKFFGSPTAPLPGSATINCEGERMENVNRRPVAMTLVVLGAVARLVPHPWNFAPVGGMSLFAGARLRGWWAWTLPIVLMAITDPLVGGCGIRRARYELARRRWLRACSFSCCPISACG